MKPRPSEMFFPFSPSLTNGEEKNYREKIRAAQSLGYGRAKGLIERAYVQRPSIYLESALPPTVNYFHLEVPGHIAMLTSQ